MSNLREIESLLARDVEDKLLQDLGYREFRVFLPDGSEVLPRPGVKELVSQNQLSRALPTHVLQELEMSSSAVNVYQIALPRTVPETFVRASGPNPWSLQGDGQSRVNVAVLGVQMKDSRWLVTVGILKRNV